MRAPAATTQRQPLAERLASNSDGVLEQIAREYEVSTFTVVDALPKAHRTVVAGDRFETVMADISKWGEVLVIVHTADIVLECKGALPLGSFSRGYYNVHGDSPIGGHIRAENCASIAFVSRPFMGRASCSVQFFNKAGEARFKVFVRRDAQRELIASQVAEFEGLRARLEAAS